MAKESLASTTKKQRAQPTPEQQAIMGEARALSKIVGLLPGLSQFGLNQVVAQAQKLIKPQA